MRVIVADHRRCLACHSCELACAVAHSETQDLAKAVLAREKPSKRIFVEAVGEKAIPLSCRQCQKALCVRACPTHALVRDPVTGAIVVQAERCIGCYSCVLACPFGVIELISGQIVKCDLCDGDPACVKACPTRALRLIRPEELVSRRRQLAASRFLKFKARREDEGSDSKL